MFQLARALRLCPPDAKTHSREMDKAAQRVREMEAGKRDISGPVSVAVEAFEEGFRPRDFRD